ncbi:MAG TPA: DUF6282 family protein [Patescibacteria group bacterium]|nr:DUF6282 family protein [Patescibacteria group bacterium]
MKDLIRGAYDLHVHSAPDILPRKMDDLEMAQRIIDSGMAGYAIKSHYFCTAERAALVNKLYPECNAIGAITLNSSTGGINPIAVEMAARAGTKIVWFPTCDSEYELSHVFNGDPNKKLPYWAQIIIDLKEEGVKTPTIKLLDDNGKLKDEVYDVIDVIAKKNIVLATSHSSHEETFALVKAAHERKVDKIVITHVDFPTTFYTIDEQKDLAKYGAYMEHCYTTFATGKVNFETTLEQIRALGADRVILGTDLGQKNSIYPDEGLLEFATRLYENGFTEKEVRKMTVDNNAALVR